MDHPNQDDQVVGNDGLWRVLTADKDVTRISEVLKSRTMDTKVISDGLVEWVLSKGSQYNLKAAFH
ncbi:MAG: hypothetical protein AAFY09_00270 [Pseudomonadota bacterium]